MALPGPSRNEYGPCFFIPRHWKEWNCSKLQFPGMELNQMGVSILQHYFELFRVVSAPRLTHLYTPDRLRWFCDLNEAVCSRGCLLCLICYEAHRSISQELGNRLQAYFPSSEVSSWPTQELAISCIIAAHDYTAGLQECMPPRLLHCAMLCVDVLCLV